MVSEKLKEILTEEELKTFDESIQTMVESRVAEELELQKTKLDEEYKVKYEEISKQYIEEQVKTALVAKEAELIKENDEKIQAIEDKVVHRIGAFMDTMITESISDDLLTKVAINELAMPVLEKIKYVLESENIIIEPKTQKKIEESAQAVKDTQKLLSESYAKNMELEEKLEKLAVLLVCSEKTQGLTESAKAKVTNEFKSRPFDEVQDKIDGFVSLIRESSDFGINSVTVTKPAPTKKTPVAAKRPTVISESAELNPPSITIPSVVKEDLSTTTELVGARVTEEAERYL